jgi:hypothetical protein
MQQGVICGNAGSSSNMVWAYKQSWHAKKQRLGHYSSRMHKHQVAHSNCASHCSMPDVFNMMTHASCSIESRQLTHVPSDAAFPKLEFQLGKIRILRYTAFAPQHTSSGTHWGMM